jgi:TonB family protein
MADAVLTNSEVQIVVDETGRVFAPPILVSKSGSDEADASALELARSARFQSVRPRGPRHAKDAPQPLAWGKLVFEWQTVPILPTNTPGMGRRP